jgi:uncharacterized protein Yka (UPF0111/DUF47 family)
MKLWNELFKKADAFQDLIKKQAQLTVEGVNLLYEFMGVSEETQNADVLRHNLRIQLKKVESEGDKARRELISELNKSLITPLDRQDLFNLSNVIDNILDYALSTVEEMLVYNLYPNYYLRKMIEKVSRGANHISYAVEQLFKDKQLVNNNIVASKVMENEIEETYREALADLFEKPDFHYIFKMREVYRHISNAGDRLAEAAEILGNILIKEV